MTTPKQTRAIFRQELNRFGKQNREERTEDLLINRFNSRAFTLSQFAWTCHRCLKTDDFQHLFDPAYAFSASGDIGHGEKQGGAIRRRRWGS